MRSRKKYLFWLPILLIALAACNMQTSEEASKEQLQYGSWWTIGTIEPDKRTDFLQYHGFSGSQPFYVYYNDSDGQVQLELYYDKERAAGCGIRYVTQSKDAEVMLCVFAFYETRYEDWQPPDVYSVLSPEGRDGKDEKQYSEKWEYNEAGRLTAFRSEALLDWVDPSETKPRELINVQFVYRGDGTLQSREFSCNPLCFATSGCYSFSAFDEQERLVFTRTYITHGSIEEYYIYEDDGSTPAYRLSLDENPGWQFYPLFGCYDRE